MKCLIFILFSVFFVTGCNTIDSQIIKNCQNFCKPLGGVKYIYGGMFENSGSCRCEDDTVINELDLATCLVFRSATKDNMSESSR